MRPQKLSKKLNPLGEIMNLPDAFNKIKNTKHNTSFENLGEWLNNNTSKPKKMKSLYKIAASFVLTVLIFVACSIPVQHEEEIGYMIKGITSNNDTSLVDNMKNAKFIFGKQVVMSLIVTENGSKKAVKQAEIILMLPKADIAEANSKMDKLNAMFNFDTVDLLPIEEEIEVPLYEAALSQVNINFGKEVSEKVIIERFNKVLHENSSIAGKAELNTDKDGNKVIEIIIEESEMNAEMNGKIKGALHELDPNSIKSITVTKDANGNRVIDMDLKEDVKN